MLKSTTLDIARIRDTVSGLIEKHHLPGLSVGVVSGDDLIYAEGFGVADIESAAPMTPDHRQRIASITKTMVSLCIMALVDEGRLSLDDRVVKVLPDIPFDGHADSLTLQHLLTHTGGVGEAPTLKEIGDPFRLLFSAEQTPKSLVDGYAEGFTIEVEPGTKWAYANHGFFLLGEIISRIEGEPFPDVARRRIFEPLGMVNSDVFDRAHPDLSTGYHRVPSEDERELRERAGQTIPDEQSVDGHNIRGKFLAEWGRGAAGGAQSTIPDMGRYASALLAGGRGIVQPETFEKMVSPHWRPDPRLSSWGLGFSVGSLFGHRNFGHGGSAFGGWNSHIAVFPDDNLATLIHMNLVYDYFDDVRTRIVQAVLGAPDETVADRPVDPAVLASARGVYEAPIPGPLTNFRVFTTYGRIQISTRDGGLILHSRRGAWKGGVRLVPAGDEHDLFVLDTGAPQLPRVVAIRDRDGRVTGFRFDQTILFAMQRNDDLEPWT